MQNLKEDLINKINKKIKENKIKMKPKIFFILKGFLLTSFLLIFFLAAIYIGNFILLIFHEYRDVVNDLNISKFDFYKFLNFLKMIPGLLIIFFIIFVFSFYKLIKEHSFVYRKSRLYIIFALFIFLIAAVINIHLFLDKDFNKIKFRGDKSFLPIKYLHIYYKREHSSSTIKNPKERNINNRAMLYDN